MNAERQFSPVLRFLIAGACIVIIVAGLKAAAPMLNIVLLALLLAQSISPLPDWLMKKRLSSGLAVLVTLLIVIIGGLAVISLLGASLAGLIQKLPTYQAKLTALWDGIKAFLDSRGIAVSKLLPLDIVGPGQVVHFAGSLFGTFAQALGNGFLLIFIVVIMLLEFAEIRQKQSAGGYPPGMLLSRLEEMSQDTRKYVAITGLTGLLQAVVNVIVLEILGIDFAVTWGVLFFFLNFVPVIGFFVALVPPVLIALLDAGWQKALLVVVGWWAINFIFDNIVKPRFMKRGLDVSPLLVLLGLIFWSWALGPVGAIFAVPLTLTVRRLAVHLSAVQPNDKEAK